MARLPDLGRLPLAPTGVMGDEEPDLSWTKDENKSTMRRLRKEYKDALLDFDNGLQDTLLTVTPYLDGESDMVPLEWTFYVANGLYEIVVRFPREYPFHAPYYYVKTFGGVLVELKRYVTFVARKEGGRVQDYVYDIGPTELNYAHNWSPALHAIRYVKRVVNDPLLKPLMEQASETHVDFDLL